MRTTISLDDKVADLAEKIAAKEKRNFSNLCEVALAEYCGPRELAVEHAELIAIAQDPAVGGIDNAIAALKREARKRKAAA